MRKYVFFKYLANKWCEVCNNWQNATQYSKKAYNQFNQFHNNNNILKYELFTVLIIILLIYCIVTTIRAKVIPLVILFFITLSFPAT